MLVVDASVLAPALADDGDDGDWSRNRLLHQTLAAPELIDLEVASVFRRLAMSGQLPQRRAELALKDLSNFPIHRTSHRMLTVRCWELRNNLSIYDAAYVALAEALDVVLLTADTRLAQSPGLPCQVELMGADRK